MVICRRHDPPIGQHSGGFGRNVVDAPPRERPSRRIASERELISVWHCLRKTRVTSPGPSDGPGGPLGGDARSRDAFPAPKHAQGRFPYRKEVRAMRYGFRAARSVVPTVSMVISLWALTLAPSAFANEVLQWNETTMQAIAASGQNNVVSTRTLAMVQAAVHDALNAINRRYDAYYFEGPGEPAASPDAAVAAAAHAVLVGVVGGYGTPAQKGPTFALVDQAYAASLARVADGPARNKGVAVGRAAGAAMLTLRKDDGAFRDAPYTPGVGPGRWRPHPNPV